MATVDAYVKGHSPLTHPHTAPAQSTHPASVPLPPTDPLTPSSPQQIYHNLLILEHSLRQQYLQLTLRRRKYTFFFSILLAWTGYFFHRCFLAAPTPYTTVSTLEWLAFTVGAVTIGLFYLTGLYARALVWPRKFVGNTNKGIRQFNIKLVAVRVGWWDKMRYFWYELCPPEKYVKEVPRVRRRRAGSFIGGPGRKGSVSGGLSGSVGKELSPRRHHTRITSVAGSVISSSEDDRPHYGSHSAQEPLVVESEDLVPSGSHVKIVVLAKGFSAEFREGWEVYRDEYWEKENEFRARLRKELRARGWWWKRWWEGRKKKDEGSAGSAGGSGTPVRRSRRMSTAGGAGSVKRRSLLRPDDAGSRTPTPEPEKGGEKMRRERSGKGKRRVSGSAGSSPMAGNSAAAA